MTDALIGTFFALMPLWYLWSFWGVYVLTMGLYRAKLDNRLGPFTRLLGFPFIGLAWLMDVIANLTLASLIFWELPKEMFVTARLNRHLNGTGWRASIAGWVCTRLLDIFDPTGKHCR